MTEPEIDHLTLRQAARGERAACARFVARYQSVAWSAAARVLGRASPDVPDAAQDALLRALAALPGFDPEGSARPSTWLATIATRVALDVARRRRAVVSLEVVRETADAQARDPGDALDEARRTERLARAMERLGADQRAVIALRIEHGLSYEQVAETLGIEVGTVKSRLARARQALAAAVDDAQDAKGHHG